MSSASDQPPHAITHFVLDWNGTLLDDIASIWATDTALGERYGYSAIDTLDDFRDRFLRNWPEFRNQRAPRPFDDTEQAVIYKEWLAFYAEQIAGTATLFRDAVPVLKAMARKNVTASVCSMNPHEMLVPLTERLHVAQYFTAVSGAVGLASGASKTSHLKAHLESLDAEPRQVAMIGDDPDDAIAALANGIQVALVSTGLMSERRVRAAADELSVPTFCSLSEAVQHFTPQLKLAAPQFGH